MELTGNWLAWKMDSARYENPGWMKDSPLPAPLPAPVPGTVASLLLDSDPRPLESLADIDRFDWWYSTKFEFTGQGTRYHLVFDGLAALADVWLNDEKILRVENMFRQFRVDVTDKLKENNQLVICFRSLREALEAPQKRPKWKTKLVESQNLRWFRTTLLGYIPGWTPPVKPIGPWRGVRLESADAACLTDFSLQTAIVSQAFSLTASENTEQGGLPIHPTNILKIKADINYYSEQPCEIILEINGESHSLYTGSAPIIQLDEEIAIPNVRTWMPHTHGEANLYRCKLMLKAGNQFQVLKEAQVGFRQVNLNQENGLFQMKVNGKPVFARGAVWTINDIVSLTGSLDDLRTSLLLAHEAGMNMLRVGGTMIYEQDAFYDLCDELGIMVWQDFMFANMDYPVKDAAFHENILAEATQQLKRLSAHPCVVVYCGNSEVEQQAAMLGIPSEMWRNEWFANELPALVNELHANSIYVPSSPSGGILPFYTSEGVTHYYGVGAYLRDLSDVRRADVKFTPECLGFSNVPEEKTLAGLMDDRALWKSRVPRDAGAEWDFEDVRDHYLAGLFGEDPAHLRSADLERYLMLSRIASGEMMSQVFSEWRTAYSHCGGGLVWFYKDLWPSAGWGVIDSGNHPKAAYYFLKRVFQSVGVFITDEGLQGLYLHLVNESDSVFQGVLEFCMVRDGNVFAAKAQREVMLESGQRQTVLAEDLLGGFYDTAYAYRFGPPQHEVACALLKDKNGNTISRQFHFPLKQNFRPVAANVDASLTDLGEGFHQLSIQSDQFLYAVRVDCEGYLPDDNYFHLLPKENRRIVLKPTRAVSGRPQALIRAVNLQGVAMTGS